MKDIKTIQLSEDVPYQSGSPYGGYRCGDQATIFWDREDESYGYCYHGIGADGNSFESDDVTGFATADEAVADAIDSQFVNFGEDPRDWEPIAKA